MLKASQKRTKRARLDAGVDIEHSRKKRRLIGDDPHRATVHSGEADHDVAREMLVDLEEISVVDQALDDRLMS